MSVQLKTAVTQLFETETQRRIIAWALDDANEGEYYTTGHIGETIGKSRNAVADVVQPREGVIGPMIRFGILEPKHNPMNMLNIPHYKVADSEVVDLLEQWHEMDLTELVATSPAARRNGSIVYQPQELLLILGLYSVSTQ